MTEYHIAQFNLAKGLYPLDDPGMSGFVDQLETINAVADGSSGFVWRLQDETGDATNITVGDDPRLIINMSVWRTVEALFDFVYKTAHTGVMVQRRQWFDKPNGAYHVLWWVEAGHIPTVEEGLGRLRDLDADGPSPRAFTFKRRFPAPDQAGPATDMHAEPYCVGWP